MIMLKKIVFVETVELCWTELYVLRAKTFYDYKENQVTQNLYILSNTNARMSTEKQR